MKRKWIISLSIIIIIISIICVGLFYLKDKTKIGNEHSLDIPKEERKTIDKKTEPNKPVEDSNTEEVVEELPTTSNQNNDNNKVVSEPSQNKKADESIIEQKVEEPKEQQKEENKKEPVIDPEYERLLTLVEYKTHEECLNAGINYQLKNIVEITNTMCQTIGYNNQLLGYKLTLWCGNDTCNNYKSE